MIPAIEIKKIEGKLDDALALYTNFGDSGISDAEYDSLIDRLRVLDPKNKRLKSVGADVPDDSKWEKYIHAEYPLGSQSKVVNFPDLKAWSQKFPGSEYAIEHKLDGSSLKMIYENGKFTKGITRGKNKIGEDITRNVLKMQGVPKTISEKRRVIVRSETLLYKSKLDKVGGKNTRNTSVGTAKRHDGVGCNHLNVVAYNIMNWKELGIKTHAEMVKTLKDWGFTTVSFQGPFKTIEEVEKVKIEWETNTRKNLDWDIDGLVIVVNALADDAWDYPTRAIAYKFASEEAVTKLLAVEWRDTGGRIAPRAILEPVNIGGVTVTHATLNNVDFIKEKGVKINDLVIVSRRNDVIPAVEGVSIAADDGIEIKAPTKDADGFPIVFETNVDGEQLVYLISTNPNSKSKKIRKILAWYREHDTKGLAGETIEAILEAKCADDLPSFYDVGINGHDNLMNVDGFGAGKYKVLQKATLLTSHTDIIRFFGGLDIQGFGSRRFESILNHLNRKITAKEFKEVCLDVATIASIPKFGDNTARTLAQGINENDKIITAMLSRVKCDDWEPAKVAAGSKVAGKTFCFTGSHSMDRDELEKLVKKHGGLIAGVSKNLDYLVSPDGWTSGKVDKAKKLGTEIINEETFLNILGG